MKNIELMLTGQMEMPEFVTLLNSNQQLQKDLQNLIPIEAIANKNHDFWKCISFDSFERCHFDFLKLLNWICRFDGTVEDNLNIFGSIRPVYMYSFPDIVCTNKFHDAFDLYIEVIRDCFAGPEVRCLIEKIIQDALLLKSKRKQREQARMYIQTQFHVTDMVCPRWIQGPEWPMGTHSPMRFIDQKRVGEQVQYLFEDIDTKRTRIIIQFY